MRFIAFVGTHGPMSAGDVDEMNRGWPAYAAELERRGGLRLGRELSLPEAGVTTVRVRDGETLVTDGPFAETKEFVAGLDLFESPDLEEAIGLESRSPVARFLPFELRPLPEEFRIAPAVAAFRDGDDSAGVPYLLTVWVEEGHVDAVGAAVSRDCEAWRSDAEAHGVFVLGGSIGTPGAATTLRIRDGELHLTDGSFIDAAAYINGIEVIRSSDRRAAVELAAQHPLARHHAIEVRSFYSDAGQS